MQQQKRIEIIEIVLRNDLTVTAAALLEKYSTSSSEVKQFVYDGKRRKAKDCPVSSISRCERKSRRRLEQAYVEILLKQNKVA
jgi:hypothetical protein